MKYNIVCHDKKSFEITEEQRENIYKLSSNNMKGFEVNGEYITFSNIARIEKSMAQEYKPMTSLPEPTETYSDSRHKRRLTSLREGFLRGVGGKNDLTPVQVDLLANMGHSLDRIEKNKTSGFVMGRDNN